MVLLSNKTFVFVGVPIHSGFYYLSIKRTLGVFIAALEVGLFCNLKKVVLDHLFSKSAS